MAPRPKTDGHRRACGLQVLLQRLTCRRGLCIERLSLLNGDTGRHGIPWVDGLLAPSRPLPRVGIGVFGGRGWRCGLGSFCLEMTELFLELGDAAGCEFGGPRRL